MSTLAGLGMPGLTIPGVGDLSSIYTRIYTPEEGFRQPDSYPFVQKALDNIPFRDSLLDALSSIGLRIEDYSSPMSSLVGPYTSSVIFRTSINGWMFDATYRTEHVRPLKITSHPVQTGANITDHSFVEPATLGMDIGMSDVFYRGATQFTLGDGRSKSAWDKLIEIQKSRVPLEVVTPLGIYTNMLIENITAQDDLTTYSGLRASLQLKEILIADAPDTTISALPNKTDGTQRGDIQGSTVGNGSVLSQIEDMLEV